MMMRPIRSGVRAHRRRGAAALALGVVSLGAWAFAGPALADPEAISTSPAAAVPPAASAGPGSPQPSEIMVINLIRLLVKQGVITQAAADALVQQAEAEAQQARAAAAQAPGA